MQIFDIIYETIPKAYKEWSVEEVVWWAKLINISESCI